jgi:hypothetical protein
MECDDRDNLLIRISRLIHEIGEQQCRMLIAKGLLTLKPATNASMGVIAVDSGLLDALGEDEMQHHVATWREFRLPEFTDQELAEYEEALLLHAAHIKLWQVLKAKAKGKGKGQGCWEDN